MIGFHVVVLPLLQYDLAKIKVLQIMLIFFGKSDRSAINLCVSCKTISTSIMEEESNYRVFFSHYQKTVHQIEVDIRFWKHFLTISIDRYKLENPENRWIHQSGFSIYDFSLEGSGGWLKSSDLVSSIEINDLNQHSNKFFIWIMNLAIIRIYNSLELLFLQTIQYKFLSSLENPIKGKKYASKINSEIKEFLKAQSKNDDTTNNRHIISFLKEKSLPCKKFLSLPVNKVNCTSNWENFYEFFSILRNIITHDGMIVSKNVNNNLKSIAGDIYSHFFELMTDKEDPEILQVKNEEYFLNFLILVNDLAGNCLKFVAGKPDLKFIGLK
jgi:hypothetical protein